MSNRRGTVAGASHSWERRAPGGQALRWRTLSLFGKVLSNSRRNLTIGHLVNCFNPHDASTEVVSFKTCFELVLCLTRAKYQNGFCITNRGNDRIIVDVEMSGKRSLAAIICWYLL